jgi:Zn-dependent peptidase ImmA (M78 family)/transcriptional regulator with XRE-family HTH domain
MNNKFNPKMLTLARESRGLSQLELSEETKIQQSILSKLEQGFRQMDEETLVILSKVLDYPESFFYQNVIPYPPNGQFRKRLSVPAKILSTAEAQMNIYRANIQALLNSVELPPKNFPVVNYENNEPAKIARQLRAYWRVPNGPINNLTELLESKGIIVIHCDFKTDKIDGRSMTTEDGHPILFINKDFPGDRQRLTLAHELAHVVLHTTPQNVFERDIEDEAFEFGSEFLMPRNEILSQVAGKVTIQLLGDMKRYWKVSMQAILFWSHKIGALNDNQAKYIWTQFASKGMRKEEPIVIPKEIPTLTQELIQAHLNDLEYSQEQLALLLCLRPREFEEKFLDKKKPKLKIIR